MRSLITPLIVAPLVLCGLPAFAQGNPSADQIIQSLKPSGNLVHGSTRGIRLVAPSDGQAATTSAPTSAPAPQQHVAAAKPAVQPPPTQSPSGPSVNLTVNFAAGSADLTPEAIHALDALGKALASQDLAGYKFRIEGHTDTVGTPEYNQHLSDERAQAVVSYIAKKYGVSPDRLQAIGMGETGLLVPTPPQTSEPRNRRVQVINLGA